MIPSTLYVDEYTYYVESEKQMQMYINQQKEIILGMQHSSVITKGTNAKESELFSPPSSIPTIDTKRGGKYTLHSPGQLMIYPILFMKRFSFDLMCYIQVLEESIIHTLKLYKIKAVTENNVRGVFIQKNNLLKKIAFIGLRISKGMSYYGISINISNDLSLFEHIIPCGLQSIQLTSLKQEGVKVSCKEFFESFCDYFLNQI